MVLHDNTAKGNILPFHVAYANVGLIRFRNAVSICVGDITTSRYSIRSALSTLLLSLVFPLI